MVMELNAAQLNSLTKAEIIKQIVGNQKTSKVIFQQGDNRGMTKQVTETKDGSGKLISTRTATTTYYKSGEVDEITIVEIGQSTRIIKHFTDGTQPVQRIVK